MEKNKGVKELKGGKEGVRSGCFAGERMEGRGRDQGSQKTERGREYGRRDSLSRISASCVQGLGVILTVLTAQITNPRSHTLPLEDQKVQGILTSIFFISFYLAVLRMYSRCVFFLIFILSPVPIGAGVK